MEEVWESVKGFESYEVSNLGRVKSLERYVKNGFGLRFVKERILKPRENSTGYLTINFYGKPKKIHQLVAIAFLRHTPNGFNLVVDHIDNNKLNNRLDNLQIITNRLNCSKDRQNKSSKFTGIHYCKTKNRWIPKIQIDKVRIILGSFHTEEEAITCYNKKLKDSLIH